jgi:hypothetical protein
MTKIAEYIKNLADNGDEIYAKVCKVDMVDTNNRTCDVSPLDGSAKIYDVRLQADIGGSKGFLIVPVKGSRVIVNWINKNAAFVALTYDIDSVNLRGDSFGGLIKIEDLVNRLNAVEKDLNNLKTVMKSWTVATGDGGTALKLAAAGWYGSNIEITKRNNLENTKVKHG